MTIPCDEKEFVLVSRHGNNNKKMMKIVCPIEFKVRSQREFGENMGLYNVKVKKDACGLNSNVHVKKERSVKKKRCEQNVH